MAVEKLLQLEIPERAQTIRVLMCELNASHRTWFGSHARPGSRRHDFSFYCFPNRKDLNLIEAASGGRLTPSLLSYRGLMMDLPPGFERRSSNFRTIFCHALGEFQRLVTGNRIFQKRTQGVGYISAEMRLIGGFPGRVCGAAASHSTFSHESVHGL